MSILLFPNAHLAGDNDSIYSEDLDNSAESELLFGADNLLMSNKFPDPMVSNTELFETNKRNINSHSVSASHGSTDTSPKWSHQQLHQVDSIETAKRPNTESPGAESPTSVLFPRMHGMAPAADQLKPYGTLWDLPHCKMSLAFPGNMHDLTFGQIYQIPRITGRNLTALSYPESLCSATPSVVEIPESTTCSNLQVRPDPSDQGYSTNLFDGSAV